MKICKSCGKEIKCRMLLNGKVVNTQRRKYCYDCSPFGSGNNQLLKCKNEQERNEVLKVRRKKRSAIVYKAQKRHRKERKSKLIKMFGGKCVKCGYKKCMRALEFHHLEKDGKEFALSALGYTCSWERLVREAKKCLLICSNCHREIEEELESEYAALV